MARNETFSGDVLSREIEHIMPLLINKLWGNGSLHLDTDTISEAHDYRTLEWLSRIIAGFVSDERNRWKSALEEVRKQHQYETERAKELDSLLKTLVALSQREEVTVEQLGSYLSEYRDSYAFFSDSNYGRNPKARHFSPDHPAEEASRDVLAEWKQELDERVEEENKDA